MSLRISSQPSRGGVATGARLIRCSRWRWRAAITSKCQRVGFIAGSMVTIWEAHARLQDITSLFISISWSNANIATLSSRAGMLCYAINGKAHARRMRSGKSARRLAIMMVLRPVHLDPFFLDELLVCHWSAYSNFISRKGTVFMRFFRSPSFICIWGIQGTVGYRFTEGHFEFTLGNIDLFIIRN